MTVRMPTEAEKRRAEEMIQGILPELPDDDDQPGAKGRAEAKKRFGK